MTRHYILIHGIGNQDPNGEWLREAIQHVPDDEKHLWHGLYWEDLRTPPPPHWLRWAREWNPITTLPALSGLMDLLLYSKQSQTILSEVYTRFADIVEGLPPDTEIVVVAHSLGSVLAYQLLSCIPVHEATQLITLGSPLGRYPVKQKILQWQRDWDVSYRMALPIPWLNVSGTKDYVTSWLGSGRIEAVENVIVPRQTHSLSRYIQFLNTSDVLYSEPLVFPPSFTRGFFLGAKHEASFD